MGPRVKPAWRCRDGVVVVVVVCERERGRRRVDGQEGMSESRTCAHGMQSASHLPSGNVVESLSAKSAAVGSWYLIRQNVVESLFVNLGAEL